MGLDNVAVQWPRTGRFYDPVAPAEFVDFAGLAEKLPLHAGPAAALADHVAKTGTVRVTGYTELVDLLFGLNGVLFATDAAGPACSGSFSANPAKSTNSAGATGS